MDSAGDLPKGGVSPFGYPRINDRSHLPAAFRSVPRPSSPLSAQASTERPCHAPDNRRNRRRRPRAGPNRPRRTPPSPSTHPAPAARKPPARGARTTHTQSRFICERTRRPVFRSRGTPGGPGFGDPAAAPRAATGTGTATPRHQETWAPRGRGAEQRMEAIGFEPTTPCLQSRCSPS